ncbi:hypothetical protein RRG08_058699 [Elysia crispata]|uniref:Uncharacterized protein n=1 Tax=Elysia crispata TaxID=231223 RepID=A0AAE1D5T1_9GAST|nr:hypothetical protein RRG08_058699 [Elysia crispata]
MPVLTELLMLLLQHRHRMLHYGCSHRVVDATSTAPASHAALCLFLPKLAALPRHSNSCWWGLELAELPRHSNSCQWGLELADLPRHSNSCQWGLELAELP